MIRTLYQCLRSSSLILLTLLSILLLETCATNPVTGKRELMIVSEQQELAMGEQSDPAIVAQFGLYPDQKLQSFITQKGKEMAAVSHRPDLPYEFKVLDSPVVNAFAVPGGYVYFTRGILAHFNDEAQFAGVLGHEIGHITARHSAKQQTRATFGQIGLIGGMILSPGIAQNAQAAMQGLQLLMLKYGRDAESQSDKLGVEYSTKIGYDAHKMADFFATLDRLSGGSEGRLPSFLSTHPDPVDRNRKVKAMATDWQQKDNKGSYAINRNSYLRMIDGIVYGEDPKQGFVENGVFYHPELRFQFSVPRDWQLANSPQMVQMAPKDGKAIINFTLAQGTSLEQAAQKMLEENQLQLVSSREQRVNGLSALEVIADLVQEQQNANGKVVRQVIRSHTYFIKYGSNIYQIMGLTMEPDYNTYRGRFVSMMNSFSELTDSEKINRQPERIKIETVSRAMTLQEALRGFNVKSDRHNELAVLNGMNLTDRLLAGTLIKTVK